MISLNATNMFTKLLVYKKKVLGILYSSQYAFMCNDGTKVITTGKATLQLFGDTI